MEIKVYLDVMLFINLLFNYLLLHLARTLLKQHVPTRRLLFSALLGAIYAVCVFFAKSSFAYSTLGRLLLGAGMAILAFLPRNLKTCLKYISVFYVSTFLLGGIAFFVYSFTGLSSLSGVFLQNGTFYVNMPLSLVFLLYFICFCLLKIAFAVGAHVSLAGKQVLKITVFYKNKKAHLRAFLDSGNFLKDEISGKGVIVAEKKSIQSLLSDNQPELVPIPCRTVQGTSLLYAFLPDAIYLSEQGRCLQTDTYYIAFTDEILDYYKNWDAILPHDFTGGFFHEKHTHLPLFKAV